MPSSCSSPSLSLTLTGAGTLPEATDATAKVSFLCTSARRDWRATGAHPAGFPGADLILSMRHVLVASCTPPNAWVTPSKWDVAESQRSVGSTKSSDRMPSLSLSGGEGLMRKQPAQIVTNKRSPVVHVSTEVPRPLGEAFEDIARANGITKAELLRRLIQALVEKMKTGR
jgi:hypothetical protein